MVAPAVLGKTHGIIFIIICAWLLAQAALLPHPLQRAAHKVHRLWTSSSLCAAGTSCGCCSFSCRCRSEAVVVVAVAVVDVAVLVVVAGVVGVASLQYVDAVSNPPTS